SWPRPRLRMSPPRPCMWPRRPSMSPPLRWSCGAVGAGVTTGADQTESDRVRPRPRLAGAFSSQPGLRCGLALARQDRPRALPLREGELLRGTHALLGLRSSELDRRGAVAHHPELLSGPIGQVDRAAGDVGPPVVDSHEHVPPVVQVDDLDTRAERKRWMRSGPGIHVVGLAAGARAA